MIYSAEVKLWGTTIGAVSLDETQKYAQFEYDADFISSGIQVAPIMMPLKRGVFQFPELSYESFHGLPGMLSDSLPDKFGNDMINVWLTKQGRLIESFNAVERLCYTGKRGMGALEFYPLLADTKNISEKINVSELVELASLVLANRNNLHAFIDECDKQNMSKSLQEIISVGTSAGGARAKAVIAWNKRTNEVRSGQVKTDKGFEHYLIKFSGVKNNKDKEESDLDDFGKVEYAYYLMATDAGIKMSECSLLNDGKNSHFMTKRFDRTDDGKKLHMQTLSAIGHFDFNQAGNTSYEQTFAILNALKASYQDKKELFRRMIFNVAACNCDDHVKNISFLMDKTGQWSLSPAYDVTFAFNPMGMWTSSHQMTINGKRKNFEIADFENCAKIAGLKKNETQKITEQVIVSIVNWKIFAQQAGVNESRINAISSVLSKNFKFLNKF